MITSSSVYSVPDGFEARLEAAFAGRLRIRWSLQRQAWIVEQKVGRAALLPIRVDAHRDDLIQARDGYALVMVIQPGSRIQCEFCNLPISVPDRQIVEVPCTYCLAKGRDARFVCAYWPLDETLIDHLKMIDPEMHGGREMKGRLMDELGKNDLMVAKKDADKSQERDAIGRYYFPQMFGIQSVAVPATYKRT